MHFLILSASRRNGDLSLGLARAIYLSFADVPCISPAHHSVGFTTTLVSIMETDCGVAWARRIVCPHRK
jgi:hypothetical protein